MAYRENRSTKVHHISFTYCTYFFVVLSSDLDNSASLHEPTIFTIGEEEEEKSVGEVKD